MKQWVNLAVLCSLLLTSSYACSDTSQKDLGERVFNRWCLDCHGSEKGYYGDGLPGTDALAAKYQGKLPSLLTERTDLTADSIRYYVRNGVSIMPFFRQTEISDKELNALSSFLSR